MVHALAGLDKPVPDWVYILVFGGPVALVSLVWWMGKRGWIKLADDDPTPRFNPASGLPMVGMTDTDGNLYGIGRSSSFSDE